MNARQRELVARALRLEAEAKLLRADAVLAGGDVDAGEHRGARGADGRDDEREQTRAELKRRGLL